MSDESNDSHPEAPEAPAAPTKAPAPKEMQKILAEKRMAQQQAQVDEVVGIMRTNVEKVLERDSKLTQLDERAEALQSGASQFEMQAGNLKRKFWRQNTKFIILGLILVLMMIGLIYYHYHEASQGGKRRVGYNSTLSDPEVVLDSDETNMEKPKLEYKMP